MTHQLFLIAPSDGTPEAFAIQLKAVLELVPAAALLLRRGQRTEAEYGQWAKAVAPIAQAHDAAVLLEDSPELVAPLQADGVHITGGIGAVRDAINMLKPGHIVGAGAIGSRHEAMLRGELEIDYLMFGDREGAHAEGAEMAAWWAETFEIPCVHLAAGLDDPVIAETGAEFIAFADEAIWTDPAALARPRTRI